MDKLKTVLSSVLAVVDDHPRVVAGIAVVLFVIYFIL